MRPFVRSGILSWLFLIGMMGSAAAFLPLSALEFTLPKLPFIGVAAVAGLLLSLREGDAGCTPALLFHTWTGRFLLAFFAVVFLSPLWSVAPFLSVVGDPPRFEGALAYVLFLALACTGVALGGSERGRGMIMRALAWSAVPVIAYGVLQFLRLDPLRGAWIGEAFLGRVFSTFGHPNFLGQFLLLALPFIALRLAERRGGWRAFWTAALLAGVIVLAATGSRAALLGLGVAVALAVVACPPKSRRWASLLAVGIILAIAVGGATVVRRFRVPTQSAGLGARGIIWSAAAGMIKARPWGYGLETVGSVSPAFLPPEISRYESLTVRIDRAHSKPLDLLLTLGPAGFVTFYGFLGLLLFHLWRRRKDPIALCPLLALAGGSVALLFGFDTLPTHAFSWLIAGMGMGAAVTAPPGTGRQFFFPALTVTSVTVTLFACVWLSSRVLFQKGEHAALRGDALGAVQTTLRASRLFPFDRSLLVRGVEHILTALPRAREGADKDVLEQAYEWEMARLRRLLPPQDATALLLGARHAALRGDADAVAAETEEALRLWPHSVLAHYLAFRAERDAGDAERAAAVARRLIRLLPEGWQDRTDGRMRILWKEHPWLEEIQRPAASGQ